MNNRNIIIVAALAVPVIGLALLSHSGTPERQPAPPRVAARAPNNQFKIPQLTEVRTLVQQRLSQLDAMSAAQYAEYRRAHQGMPATLEEAKTVVRNRLAQLQKMTQQQWEAETRQRLAQLHQMRAANRAGANRPAQPAATGTAKPATATPATPQRQVPTQQPAAR